jgi:DNA-binding NarL/FixJ family response regulator
VTCVFIVDDQALVRSGGREIVDMEGALEMVGEGSRRAGTIDAA